LEDLEAMFYKEVVHGSNGYVPGQDFYDGEGQQEEVEAAWEEEEQEEHFVHNPMSTSSRKSKRSGASTSSTCHSPEKKSTGRGKSKTKNSIVKVLDKIATTYNKSFATNHQTIQEHKDSKIKAEMKMDAEIEKCEHLAWECFPHESVVAYATYKIFKSKFNHRYFLTIPTLERRINFLQRWCKDNNMYS
jgi:hypothetical protein